MIRTILALIRKEFYQVRRDRVMLRLIFVMPMIQILLFGYVVSTDVKLIRTAVHDFDRSGVSREYVRALTAGDYFVTSPTAIPLGAADLGFEKNEYDAVVIIPEDFSQRLRNMEQATVGFMVDGANANSAAIAMGYAGTMTQQFNQRLIDVEPPISLRLQRLYNPEGESIYFMVPGIVATLLTMITVLLTSMAIVRERELGTLEQLMVTPISTPALLLGKTIPFAIIGFVEMSIALAFGILWFRIPFAGSWALLYGLAFIFLLTTLGAGILISTVTRTQQQAMFFSWFFSLFAILTSGFFTPISNMPRLVQYITYANPMRYFLKIVRGIIMKGASIDVLYPEVISMVIFGLVVFGFSWVRFSKRVK
ncbi:MAG: ABC transporter permease [Candidatus Eisenbacteria bacterium]